MRQLLSAVAYRIIQVLLFPFTLAGYVVFMARMFSFSRRTGASTTALSPLYLRWMLHRLGSRADLPCERLVLALPAVPHQGLRLATAATLLAHRLTGYVPAGYRYPYRAAVPAAYEEAGRTTFFDAALERHLDAVDQFVLLGAGYDTRAFRLPAGTAVKCFEVDTARTQAVKRRALAAAGIESSRITFVEADFERDDWLGRLVAAGFDPGKPSFFLWEAVTMYLDRRAVEATLRAIAGTAAGSVVAFDYFTAEGLKEKSFFMGVARSSLKALGEPLTFGIDAVPPSWGPVAAFLADRGFGLEELRAFGRTAGRPQGLGGLVAAVVEARH
ncbi:SAM-dependent methyltransferase [Arthrobacter sp. I2-34]|uniref:S-adenosyl-L-methionine-dependent methyltransferase n=1 Tax=Arthrobacter hankyongi TaxID=2904801 RepID=A0ABS9L3R2_9MICC|nr:SAM-dependent methyltransferase [Arthrobacter hankyongi]MCG2621198.1 SAM-dependent methyltransferase [Arthrobacter hankyongi]